MTLNHKDIIFKDDKMELLEPEERKREGVLVKRWDWYRAAQKSHKRGWSSLDYLSYPSPFPLSFASYQNTRSSKSGNV